MNGIMDGWIHGSGEENTTIKEKLEGIGMPLLGESRDREREWKN